MDLSKKKTIYLSGPMTGLPGFNYDFFNETASKLRGIGHEVVNPAELNKPGAHDYNHYLRTDIAALMKCDTIALLPGWEKSNGAHLEVHIAHRVGIEIRHLSDLL
ncbi:MAG: DUF4406 domain-containing protein [Patescibacteria group bacterium]|nr:DUF4406 domain-containing protein [Patescibacteria group bacterium]